MENLWKYLNIKWHDQISVLNGPLAVREKNGFEKVNLEEGVFIIKQRGDDALNLDSENEVLCGRAQPWNESTTFPVES